MIFELRVQSEAILDIDEAFIWYELQQPGLGFEFIGELEDGFKKLCQHPFNYSSISPHLRRIKINRFPYLIIYDVVGEVVFINAIHHLRRVPRIEQ